MGIGKFLGLQLLMFFVLGMVGSQLSDVEVLQRGVVLNFAVFYLAAMLIGYTVKNAPLVNSLGVCAVFYLFTYFAAGAQNLPLIDLIIDGVTALAFSVIGTYVGIYSRPPQTSEEDVVN